MLKKFTCLLGLSLWILSTSICFAESQSPDKILNQIYLGQPLEEIQQNFSLEFEKYDDEKKTTDYKAFKKLQIIKRLLIRWKDMMYL